MTITDTQPDATIFYTTDGTNPSSAPGASQVYTSTLHITTAGTTHVRALASDPPGFLDSAVAFLDVTITPAVGTTQAVVFNPLSTTQNNKFPVALSSGTADATICVSTDGVTTPTCDATGATPVCTGGSTQYNATNGAIQITATNTTVQAVACSTGNTNSTVGSQVYNLQAADVTASPVAGPFVGSQQVTLATATTGGLIHFTLDGTQPTCATINPTVEANAAAASTPAQQLTFTITKNESFKAIACESGFANSNIQTFAYTSSTFAPVFSYASIPVTPAANANNAVQGTYPTGATFTEETRLGELVDATGNTPGAYDPTTDVDCFTVDGTTPACTLGATRAATTCSANSTQYVQGGTNGGGTNNTAPFQNGAVWPVVTRDGQTVNIIRCRQGSNASPVASFTYHLQNSPIAVRYTASPGGTPTSANDLTSTAVDTGQNTGITFNGAADQPGAPFSSPPGAEANTNAATALDSTLTENEKVCYTLDGTPPACTHTTNGVTTFPAGNTATPQPTETVACAAGSTDNAVTPLAGQTKNLPITVKAISCKPNYQDSLERDISFGAATTSITVAVTPAQGTYNNDQLLTATPSQSISAGNGAICYTRAFTGAATFPDPACNAAKTACDPSSITYNSGDLPAVNSTTTGPSGSTATLGNQFKFLACKPGTTGTVNTVGTYALTVSPVTASIGGTATTGGTIPSGSQVVFQTTTLGTAAGTNGDPNPVAAPVTFCYASAAAAPAPSVACNIDAQGRQDGTCSTGTTAAGTTSGTNTVSSPVTINASAVYNVVACKLGYNDSGVTNLSFTTSGIASPTFDLGTGNQPVYVRSGQTLTITRPAATQICYTTDGTAPACKNNNTTDCANGNSSVGAPGGANTTTVPIAFSTTVDPAPNFAVQAVSCTGTAQSATTTSASYQLQASPISVFAIAHTTNIAQEPTENGNGVLTPVAGTPAVAQGNQTGGVDIYIGQTALAAPRTADGTDNGSICYTLDGSTPSVRFGTPTTAGSDANTATPLNNSAEALAANQVGCVAANTATVCVRDAGATPTTVGPSDDPRLDDVRHSVSVNAIQCKNTGYANSVASSATYSYTPYVKNAAFNFNGSPDTGTAAFQPAEVIQAGLDVTWDATNIYLGLTNVAVGSASDFVQFYIQGGDITPTSGTTTPDTTATGSLANWPNAALPYPVNYHFYFPKNNIGAGPAATTTPVLRHWTGTQWTNFTGDISTAIVVKTDSASYAEIQVTRAAIGSPNVFYAFGNDTSDASTNGQYPAGSTAVPAGSTGVPSVPTNVGWLREHLISISPPDFTPAPFELESNIHDPGNTFPVAPEASLAASEITTP